jgi:phage baseplate assembly protein W
MEFDQAVLIRNIKVNKIMTTFIGYSTINQYKKFTLVDYQLVKRDLLNAFNIRQGELVGRPDYGTALWDFLFEPQTLEVETAIKNEVQRVAGGDPRLKIYNMYQYPQQNGILIELQIQIVPSTTAERLSIFFDQETRRASYI